MRLAGGKIWRARDERTLRDDGGLNAVATLAPAGAGKQDRQLLLSKRAACAPSGAPTFVAAAPVVLLLEESKEGPIVKNETC